MVKYCKSCNQEKNIEDFSFKNKEKDKRCSNCKKCHSSLHKKWYEENKKSVLKRTRKNNQQYIASAKEHVANFLFKNPCIDCGEKDIRVLDFDHQRDKKYNVSSIVNNIGINKDKLNKEIEKCVIRCANCHRKKTSKEFNFWKEKFFNA